MGVGDFMRLITYIPSSVGCPSDVLRVNAEVVRPSNVVVFTDNAYGCDGELLNANEVHCVSYGGVEVLLKMLSIAGGWVM